MLLFECITNLNHFVSGKRFKSKLSPNWAAIKSLNDSSFPKLKIKWLEYKFYKNGGESDSVNILMWIYWCERGENRKETKLIFVICWSNQQITTTFGLVFSEFKKSTFLCICRVLITCRVNIKCWEYFPSSKAKKNGNSTYSSFWNSLKGSESNGLLPKSAKGAAGLVVWGWTGRDWAGLDWTGRDWTGLVWTGAMTEAGLTVWETTGLLVGAGVCGLKTGGDATTGLAAVTGLAAGAAAGWGLGALAGDGADWGLLDGAGAACGLPAGWGLEGLLRPGKDGNLILGSCGMRNWSGLRENAGLEGNWGSCLSSAIDNWRSSAWNRSPGPLLSMCTGLCCLCMLNFLFLISGFFCCFLKNFGGGAGFPNLLLIPRGSDLARATGNPESR